MSNFEIKPVNDSVHSFYQVWNDGVICKQAESFAECQAYVDAKNPSLLAGMNTYEIRTKYKKCQNELFDLEDQLNYGKNTSAECKEIVAKITELRAFISEVKAKKPSIAFRC